MEGDSSRVREKEVDDAEGIKDGNENNNNKKKRKQKKKKKRRSSSLVRFGCLRMESDENGGVDMEVEFPGERNDPTHLVIMVNGIIGSAQNWRYAAKQFLKKYPEDVIVHCEFYDSLRSERNSSMLTFDGVNVMGDRLAEEVKYVISRHPSVQKISFVGHSLGGLVARYAIARLYAQDLTRELSQTNGDCGTDHLGDSCPENKFKGKIAGLEPINFITFASPHLGSRWHKQIPLLCGSHALEKVAARTSWLLGRTGKHLFLTDGKEGKPPLLLQMIKHLPRGDKYPHVVNVETAKTATLDEVPSEAKVNGQEKINMEEEMIRGLTKVSWERVKNYWVNSDGADVVEHMIDNFLL
ncbi:hypothetical protein SCA6_008952 [Theobroma cacao]